MEHLAARGLTCPLPVREPRRRGARPPRRPAGRDRHLPRRHSVRRPNAAPLRALGGALARLHWPARDFAHGARRTRSRVDGWRGAVRRPRGRGRQRSRRASPAHVAAELAFLEAALAGRACPSGVIHADLFTDNVFFIGDDGVGADRLLFRLHRRSRLRPRGLPQRLVLRGRRHVQRAPRGRR